MSNGNSLFHRISSLFHRKIFPVRSHREFDQKGQSIRTVRAACSTRQRRPELLAKGLAPGKVNAIRAASQAGVKLSKIAQEFGLPLAAVKRIITAADGF